MKPVLYWGVVRGQFWDTYKVIRVTRDSGRQISGVRLDDISAVTLRKSDLVGKYKDADAAEAAVAQVGKIREPYNAEITRLNGLADDQRRQRDAHEKKVFASFEGSLVGEGDNECP